MPYKRKRSTLKSRYYSHFKRKSYRRTGLKYRYSRKTNRGRKKWTLKKRVKLLEGPTRKVWDVIDVDAGDGDPREYTLNWNGANITGQPMVSGMVLTNLLAIQPRTQQGLIAALSDDFQANDLNTRKGNTVYVSSLEIAARVVAPLAQPEYDDAAAGTTVSVPNIQAITTCRIHFVIVQDMRCSQTDNYGQSAPVLAELNDQLGATGEPLNLGPLESLFKFNGQPGAAAAQNTLMNFGFDNALKSFKKGLRYRIHAVHSYNLNLLKAYKDIKFRVKINRKVSFQQVRMGGASNASQPVRNSFHVIPICNWNTTVQPMEGNDTNYGPTLTNIRSRCYFRDSA